MKHTHRYFLIVVSTVAILVLSLKAWAGTGTIKQPLNVALQYIWREPVSVCWMTQGSQTEKDWVRSAVANTWEKESSIRFTGWGDCASSPGKIRIAVSDTQKAPHTKGLGAKLAGKSPGMVLNFTFNNWNSETCQGNRESCIRAIAVHEFGHALGFAHEQNRPDTPPDQPGSRGYNVSLCVDERQGSDGDWTVGVWDLSSVMNYCNPQWNNGGALSSTDIEGVRRVYGNPTTWNSSLNKWCSHKTGRLHLGDFNGDGVTDMLCHDVANGRKWISYATGLATEPYSTTPSNNWSTDKNWCGHPTGQLFTGDFNGDGRTDALCHDQRSGYKWVALANSKGQLTGTSWESPMKKWCSHQNGQLLTGDFNGDKRTDLLCHDRKSGYKWVALADSNGTFSGTSWESPMNNWCSHKEGELHVGDFNGDKRTDLLCHDIETGRKWISFASPNGTFPDGTSWQSAMRWCISQVDGRGQYYTPQLLIADMNGDDRDDLICHDPRTGWKWFSYATSEGRFKGTSWEGPYNAFCSHPTGQFVLGKFNADRSTDFMCHDTSNGQKWISFF